MHSFLNYVLTQGHWVLLLLMAGTGLNVFFYANNRYLFWEVRKEAPNHEAYLNNREKAWEALGRLKESMRLTLMTLALNLVFLGLFLGLNNDMSLTDAVLFTFFALSIGLFFVQHHRNKFYFDTHIAIYMVFQSKTNQ